jgi:hypothetical protein
MDKNIGKNIGKNIEKSLMVPKGNFDDPPFTNGPIDGIMRADENHVFVFSNGKWEEVMTTEDFQRTCFLADQKNMSLNEYIKHALEEHMKKTGG